MSVDSFKSDIQKINLVNVHLEVLGLFYQYADNGKKRIIDEPLYHNAVMFIEFYNEIINEHFCNVKKSFQPYTDGEIGLLGYYNLRDQIIGGIAFREIAKGEESVKLIPISGGIMPDNDNRFYLLGATGTIKYRGSSKGLNNIDVKQ